MAANSELMQSSDLAEIRTRFNACLCYTQVHVSEGSDQKQPRKRTDTVFPHYKPVGKIFIAMDTRTDKI